MRKAVAFRFDVDLLGEARACAKIDNRTLTNFVATAIQDRIGVIRSRRSIAADTDPALSKQPPTEMADEPLHT